MSGALSAIGIGTAAAGTAVAGTTAAVGMTAAETGFLASATAASGVEAASAFSLSSLATAATIGSSAISALGSIQQSRANAASAGYNAKVVAENAHLQTETANREGAAGEQRVGIQGEKDKAALSATLAEQGAAGVDVNAGSSVDVRASQAKLGMLDALTMRSNTAWDVYKSQINASSDTTQSQLLKKQQKQDTQGGYLNAGATVLGGVGSAAKYTNWLTDGNPF